jgi:molecular chaperone DnaK
MNRQTIDYGIDLGTTNSEIARLNGTEIEVFRNAEGFEYTPSAVWIDKKGNLVVGRVAKEWHEREPDNAFIEFKRDMGEPMERTFARSERKMKPEDLSAEVLKSLRADVERRNGEVITAAVITVPADFDLPQCEATKRAADAAGIKHCLLLQEPVAAAQAYGFEHEEDNTFWLIYDFGGGTFDAAIIQLRGGLPQVVAHGGDNQLGGKNIDWAIVESLLIPSLILERVPKVFATPSAVLADQALAASAKHELPRQADTDAVLLSVRLREAAGWDTALLADCYLIEPFWAELTKRVGLANFRRGAKQWAGAIAKFKIQAEAAKIRLSSPQESTEIVFDLVCNDAQGQAVEFTYELKRADLERLATPFIRRSINICQKTLDGQRLPSTAIAKVILVGGPTLMPILRQMLKDPKGGLGIPLEFNVDPLTVVARGAAVFAGSQRLPDDKDWKKKVQAGQFGVKLDYRSVGPDTDPPVAGVVSAGEGEEKDFTGFTVEFINPDIRPPWRSGKIGLGPKGNFMTTVAAEKGKANTFQIELRDPTGALREVNPKTFQITVKGIGDVQITLPHAIGVELSNNEVEVFFDKNAVLPAKKRRDLHTAVFMKRGQGGQLLRVPVVEGNKSRADRNRRIGLLLIPAERINRDVPVGSDIEVTIEIDQSRLIRTKAFIPMLDDEFERVLELESAVPDARQLAEWLHKAKERLKATREKAEAAEDAKANDAIQRIDSECMVPEVERLVSAAAGDPDAARQCQNLLNSLESALDDAEDALEWPALVAEAEEVLENTRKVVDGSKHATSEDKRDLATLERETREAIEHRIPDLLRRRKEGLESLRADVGLRDPGPWVCVLEDLKAHRADMTDPAQADRLIAQGDRAVENNDFNGLKVAVCGLLPLSIQRLLSAFNDLKARSRQMTDQAKAAELIVRGERAASEKDAADLDTVNRQLKELLSGVMR